VQGFLPKIEVQGFLTRTPTHKMEAVVAGGPIGLVVLPTMARFTQFRTLRPGLRAFLTRKRPHDAPPFFPGETPSPHPSVLDTVLALF